jgi:uncharacterized membrane protein YcaP (DUF421 family)
VDLAIRTIVVFTLILVITRAIGRRELGSLAPFDLILLVVVGDLVQQGVTQSDYSLTGTIIVLSTLAVLVVITSYASFRVPIVRRVLEGEPIVLVEHGRVLDRNMRRERLTREELEAEARLDQIDDLATVRFAVLETNGKISFISDLRPLSRRVPRRGGCSTRARHCRGSAARTSAGARAASSSPSPRRGSSARSAASAAAASAPRRAR